MVSLVSMDKLMQSRRDDVSRDDEYMEEQAQDSIKDRKDPIAKRKFDSSSDSMTETGRDSPPAKFDPRILESDIDNVVIPRGLDYGNLEIQRKGVKNTYYCEVCLVSLSSLETMMSHTSGAKHQKKMLALEREQEARVRLGGVDTVEKLPGVIQVPNPESAKVKVPMRLHERIRETAEPVIGLMYVKEFLAASDPEMEPYYSCELCGSKGTSNSMFSHLMGFKHRQTFVDARSGQQGGGGGKSRSQKDLLNYARNNAENSMKLDTLIVTTTSDIDYPAWPAGKAPWAVEKGGSGVPPDAVRSRMDKKPTLELGGFGRATAREEEIKLKPLNVFEPESREEGKKMMELGKFLVKLAIKSPHVSLRDSDQEILLGTLDSILG